MVCLRKAVSKIAAKRLLNKALQIRKEHVGSLLKTTRTSQSMQICDRKDFSEGCHMASTEPCFCDATYTPVKRDHAIPIDECGKSKPVCIEKRVLKKHL